MNCFRATKLSTLLFAATMVYFPGAMLAGQADQTSNTLTMSSGKTDKPIEVTDLRLQAVKSVTQNVDIPGAYTLNQKDFEQLPIAKTNRELKVKHLGVADGDTIVLFSKRTELGTDEDVFFEPCDSFEVGEDESEQIRPVNVYCNQTGYLVNGGLVALQKGDGDYAPLAQIPRRKAPVMGTDAGIALTIMKEHDSGKGYEFFEGATAYYSITRLKSPLVRMVANLSALDMDAEKDFETGLGLGVLLRTPGGLGENNNIGLGVLIGGGYNFMLDTGRDSGGNKREPWYWFVGFSWNFDRTNQ